MHCCLLILSKIPRIQLYHSVLGGGFQSPKGEFGAEMGAKTAPGFVQRTAVSLGVLASTGHVPHQPAC